MGKKVISVIIPTLNEELCIARCLKAIKNQKTKLKYEIIVSDGHSKDKTRKIARKYADKVILAKWPGIAGGRNTGGYVARGKILVFIDADTIIPPNYLDSIYLPFRDKNVAIVSTAHRFSNQSLKIKLAETILKYCFWLIHLIGSGRAEGINLCTTRRVFKKVAGFPSVPAEDFLFGERAKKFGKLVFLLGPEVVTSSRRVEKGGFIKTLLYYIQIGFASSESKDLRKLPLVKGSRYRPIR